MTDHIMTPSEKLRSIASSVEIVCIANAIREVAEEIEKDQDELKKNSERYELLRCFELSSFYWPEGASKNPGYIAFSSQSDPLTQSRLDAQLDRILGYLPPSENGALRADYQEWRKQKTRDAIDSVTRKD